MIWIGENNRYKVKYADIRPYCYRMDSGDGVIIDRTLKIVNGVIHVGKSGHYCLYLKTVGSRYVYLSTTRFAQVYEQVQENEYSRYKTFVLFCSTDSRYENRQFFYVRPKIDIAPIVLKSAVENTYGKGVDKAAIIDFNAEKLKRGIL